MTKKHFIPTNQTPSSIELAWRNLQTSRSKLKASSRISALLAGFAMVAIIEMQIDSRYYDANSYDDPILTVFVVSACLLIVVHLTAVLISTCLLPHLESYSCVPNDPALLQGPHIKLKLLIDTAWVLSTVLGIFLFLLVLAMACVIKFKGSAILAPLCIIPPSVIGLGILAIVIYRKVVTHKVSTVSTLLDTLDERLSRLESGDQVGDEFVHA